MKQRKWRTSLFFLLCFQFSSQAQQLFNENFSDKTLHSFWQIIAGNWLVADVQNLKIAPAENGHQYVLCAEGQGIIRLIIDIPDTVKATGLQLQFSSYTYLKGAGASVEIQFHKRGMKDGTRGKLFTINLPARGRWTVSKKIVSIPPGANSVYLTYIVNKATQNASKKVYFDVVQVSAVK